MMRRSVSAGLVPVVLAAAAVSLAAKADTGFPEVVAADPQRLVRRIALGSCVKQDRPQPIWQAVRGFQPDLLLLLGDNVYGDTEDMAVLRGKYAVLAAEPGFAALRRSVPIVGVWDDHDYGVNDGGREYPRRQESQQVFCDFFGLSSDHPVRQQEGIYRSVVLGPPGRRVQLLCLDTRYHRSPLTAIPKEARVKGQGPYVPSDDPEATMLGEPQWAWLAEALDEPAELRIVLSSIQLASTEHGWEHWGNLPAERSRLLELVRQRGAAGVVVVSGDRHSAEISRIPAGPDALDYPLYDLTASSINQQKRVDKEPTPRDDSEPNRHRLGSRFHGANFGTLEIDWGDSEGGARAGFLTLAIRDLDGDVVESASVPLSDLAPAASIVGAP
jgi:alkaline phosphatase D